MTVFKHELKMGRISCGIWAGAVAFLLAVCILIFPQMGGQTEGLSDIFSQMGGFSEAFGMDQVNFGEFIGFFSVECGNVLGLGGALFAALVGIGALAKEESGHTAEFLLTHPVSRGSVISQKLLAVLAQIVIFNVIVVGTALLSILMIGESPDGKTLFLMFLAYFLLQVEIAVLCFGISAFLRRGGLGIGLGAAIGFYFMNIIANLTEQADFLKYLTPFGYADGTDIAVSARLNTDYLVVGGALTLLAAAAAFLKYSKKDIS